MATPQQRLVVQAQLGEMGRVGDPWVKPHRIRRMVEHRQELPEQRVLVKVEDPATKTTPRVHPRLPQHTGPLWHL